MESLLYQFQSALQQGLHGITDWLMDNPMIFLGMAGILILIWRLMSPSVNNKL